MPTREIRDSRRPSEAYVCEGEASVFLLIVCGELVLYKGEGLFPIEMNLLARF
jgi:hypothetical protein